MSERFGLLESVQASNKGVTNNLRLPGT